MDEGFLTLQKAATYANVSVCTIRRWIDMGMKNYRSTARSRILLKASDIDEFLCMRRRPRTRLVHGRKRAFAIKNVRAMCEMLYLTVEAFEGAVRNLSQYKEGACLRKAQRQLTAIRKFLQRQRRERLSLRSEQVTIFAGSCRP